MRWMVIGLVAFGCSSEPAAASKKATGCEPWTQEPCFCPGADGYRVCDDRGEWGDCFCATAAQEGGVDAEAEQGSALPDVAVDVAPDAPPQDATADELPPDSGPDSPPECYPTNAVGMLTCEPDCAECVNAFCAAECTKAATDMAYSLFTCYCSCAGGTPECFDGCDPGVPGEDLFWFYFECIEANCPEKCWPKPK